MVNSIIVQYNLLYSHKTGNVFILLKSEGIGRCGGMKKPNDHAEPTKSNAKKVFVFTSNILLSIYPMRVLNRT